MCGIFLNINFQKSNCKPCKELYEELRKRGPDCLSEYMVLSGSLSILFIGSVLQIRGNYISPQPAVFLNENVLLFNGEIYDGFKIKANDTTAFLNELNIPENIENTIKNIKGPFSFVFWHKNSNVIWFGKDRFGRRSLLIRLSTSDLIISSIIPKDEPEPKSFREIPPGIYKINLDRSLIKPDDIEFIPYTDLGIEKRPHSDSPPIPFIGEISSPTSIPVPVITSFANLLYSSVRRRLVDTLPGRCKVCKQKFIHDSGHGKDQSTEDVNGCEHSRVAVLFSGGLDCMVISYLIDKILGPSESIDILNVAFHENEVLTTDKTSVAIKDRQNALSGVQKLSKSNPDRTWNFIQAIWVVHLHSDSDIKYLLQPGSDPILDNSIGPALWFAARGRGRLTRYLNGRAESQPSPHEYDTSAQVLFTGFGADELLAGYVRHRKVFNMHGENGLQAELDSEMANIYHRNLGRDDRIISSHGKEARYPYLDEDLVNYVTSLPLNHKADLSLPPGTGDKMLLRLLAKFWGLDHASTLPKKAIQFGSNIAKINRVRCNK